MAADTQFKKASRTQAEAEEEKKGPQSKKKNEREEKKISDKGKKATSSDDIPAEFLISRLWLKDFVKQHFLLGPVKFNYNRKHLHAMLDEVYKDISSLPTLIEVESPIFVFGDIHGQLGDLRRFLYCVGLPKNRRFLFLGDYVDRGNHSLEVIALLFALRLLYPQNIVLLRGNHELAHINKTYGFKEDVLARWPNEADANEVYEGFNSIFAQLPLAAVISKKILCMHGGLSPRLTSLQDIRGLHRPIVQPKDLAQDILWADPEGGICGFKPNELRACSFNFGQQDVEAKLKELKVKMVIRAHQVVEHGYQLFASKRVITVFSASRYQEDMWNYAAVVRISKNLHCSFIQMKPTEFDEQRLVKKDDVTADLPSDSEKKETPRGKSEKGKTCEE